MRKLVSVQNLSKSYKDFSVNNISFHIPEGKIIGLVGQNGNGKSTIIKCLLGICSYEGKIEILGFDMKDSDKQAKEHIAFAFSECPFDPILTAKDIGIIMKSLYKTWSAEAFDTYLEKFGLGKSKKLKEYSKGMLMKIMLAVALSHDSTLLILDEPTSGLDPVFRKEILTELSDYVKDGSKSVLFSTHILSDLEQVADGLLLVSKGNLIFDGSVEEFLNTGKTHSFEEALERHLGIEVWQQ